MLPGSHAVAGVGADGVLRVDPARHHAHVQVVLGTPVVVGAGAEAGHRHFLNVGPARRLLHREQAAGLLALAL